MPDINMHLKMVKHFHQTFNQSVDECPPSDDTLDLRYSLMHEEFMELLDAMYTYKNDRTVKNYANVIKEAIDLNYVLLGLFVAFGVPHNEAFALVHASNMTKDGAKDKNGKVAKGSNYKPADLLPLAKKLYEKNLHPTP